MLKAFFKYAEFSGRARRSEYWLFQLLQVLVYLGLVAVIMSTIGSGGYGALPMVMGLLGLFALACFIPNLAVTVRRLHDTGRPALWLLLYAPGLLSYFGQIGTFLTLATNPQAAMGAAAQTSVLGLIGMAGNLTMFVFMCLPGTRGPNRFGDDPKGGAADIARVFDAPEADEALAYDSPAYKEPHKPVFDFGPTPARPATRDFDPPRPAPTYNPAAQARPTFGKRR